MPLTEQYSKVARFYAGKNILITGGTGFVGKVLLEKLLRSCPHLNTIYLLIRSKDGQSPNDRLDELLNTPIFYQTKKANALKKIVPINGDMLLEDLGISNDDREMLCRQVSVVFHSAASIKFDGSLEFAVKTNVMGSKYLIALCERMANLQALVYVSTAYCNCDRNEINEIIYSMPFKAEHIIDLVKWMPSNVLEMIKPALIGEKPNTYIFTKALTEQMLSDASHSLPIVIVRPSIVIACYDEPIAGWLDNWNGPTGLLSAIGNGSMRTLYCEKDFVCNVIPVDFVVNLIIASAWQMATATGERSLKIFNCVSMSQKRTTFREFIGCMARNMIEYPHGNEVFYPNVELRNNRVTNAIAKFVYQVVSAHALDFIALIMGKTPKLVKTQRKVTKATATLGYFTMKQWKFSNVNVLELLSKMNAIDRERFQLDVHRIDWDRLYRNYAIGMRTYLWKANAETLSSHRQAMNRLRTFDRILKISALLGLLLTLIMLYFSVGGM